MRAMIITVSDRCFQGEMEDRSGPALETFLSERGWFCSRTLVPDEEDAIARAINEAASSGEYELILTTGGTGVSPRDVTPEATKPLLDKELPGIAEAIRMKSLEKTVNALLSRGVAGMIGSCTVVNLPGSCRGAVESASVFIDCIGHASAIAKGVKADG